MSYTKQEILEMREALSTDYSDSEFLESVDSFLSYDDIQGAVESLCSFFVHELMCLSYSVDCEGTLETIRRILTCINEWDGEKCDVLHRTSVLSTEFGIDSTDALQFGLLQFILCTLNEKDFIDAGCDVLDSWLTPLGDNFLTVLNWHKELIEVGEE